ncbi:hypothetical protein ACFVFF_23255 [Streptomyces sp. NPDC057680]|uniref:hypothetical protein n=1 Tax=Streptomyces sp. NPDC057680 TaxID=3346208 RepID=UPI0036A115AB
MGYASYTIQRNGETIEAGYGIDTTCEEPGCGADIDRGLAHLCGKQPGGNEHGCGGYYCEKHLYIGPNDETGDLCGRCQKRHETDPE